jgi:hypothetical protein
MGLEMLHVHSVYQAVDCIARIPHIPTASLAVPSISQQKIIDPLNLIRENQCLFVRGYRVKKHFLGMNTYSSGETQESPPTRDGAEEWNMAEISRRGMLHQRMCIRIVTTSSSRILQALHYLSPAFDYLLQVSIKGTLLWLRF